MYKDMKLDMFLIGMKKGKGRTYERVKGRIRLGFHRSGMFIPSVAPPLNVPFRKNFDPSTMLLRPSIVQFVDCAVDHRRGLIATDVSLHII